jgi:2-polyprenyl-6-methoxyphenol hydroxylase-like FAD-dependent oxidoreductase
MYKDVHTFIYEEHSCTKTWLLFVIPLVSLGWQNKEPKQIKQEALQFTKYFQVPKLEMCINNTTFEHFTKNTIRHRINVKPTCETQVVGNVTICGDAFHPTSLALAHGGCMALEDDIILARKLHQALKLKESKISKVLKPTIHETLLDSHQERHLSTNALTCKATMIGVSMNVDTSIKCFI